MASLVTPPFVGAVAWEMLAAPNSGLLNQLWRLITGAPADESLFDIYTLEGLIFAIACYTFPYVFILVANALDRMPGELEDASSMLGAGTWATARRITVPLALPTLLAGVKTAAVINVGTATVAAFIGAGGFGERIVAGLAVNDSATMLAGALPAALLALLVQAAFDLLEHRLVRGRAA